MYKMIVSAPTKNVMSFAFYELAEVTETGEVRGNDIRFWDGEVYATIGNRGVDFRDNGVDFGGGDIVDTISWDELMAMPEPEQKAKVEEIGWKVYDRLKVLLEEEEQAKVKDAKAKEAFKEMVI